MGGRGSLYMLYPNLHNTSANPYQGTCRQLPPKVPAGMFRRSQKRWWFPMRLPTTRLYKTDSFSRQSTPCRTLVSGTHVAHIEVKKSRFIGYAIRIDTWSDAKDFLENVVKAEHPKARHFCYGVSLGVDPVNERCSDDGEPTGTAGQPILQALRTEGLSDAICIVVRYFGGIKLGAGGLIRAYGAAARKVLREAPKLSCIAQSTVRVQVEPAYIGSVYEAVTKVQGICSDEQYGCDGSLTAMIKCETSLLSLLRLTLSDSTKGSVKFLAGFENR
jgi:uncharacterized YigZ family protein